MGEIVTNYWRKPMPTRESDWCAHYEGEEEAGSYGWGRTEAEAIAGFIDNCAEGHNERLGVIADTARHSGEAA